MPALSATQPLAARSTGRGAAVPGAVRRNALPARAAAAGARMQPLLRRCPAPGLPSSRTRRGPTTPAPARRTTISASADGPSPLDRVAAATPFLIPLVDSLGRGRFLFMQFPVFGLLLGPIRPLAELYYSVPFASLIVFFAVYLGIVQNQQASRFARYNAMQAILLDILLILPSLLERVVGGAPRGGPGLSVYMTASSTIFLFVLACFVAGAGSALAGKTARLPLVAEAADAQTRF